MLDSNGNGMVKITLEKGALNSPSRRVNKFLSLTCESCSRPAAQNLANRYNFGYQGEVGDNNPGGMAWARPGGDPFNKSTISMASSIFSASPSRKGELIADDAPGVQAVLYVSDPATKLSESGHIASPGKGGAEQPFALCRECHRGLESLTTCWVGVVELDPREVIRAKQWLDHGKGQLLADDNSFIVISSSHDLQ